MINGAEWALAVAVRALQAIEQGRGACEESACADVARDALATIEQVTQKLAEELR